MSYGEPRGMLLTRPFYTLKLYRNPPDRAFFDHGFSGEGPGCRSCTSYSKVNVTIEVYPTIREQWRKYDVAVKTTADSRQDAEFVRDGVKNIAHNSRKASPYGLGIAPPSASCCGSDDEGPFARRTRWEMDAASRPCDVAFAVTFPSRNFLTAGFISIPLRQK